MVGYPETIRSAPQKPRKSRHPNIINCYIFVLSGAELIVLKDPSFGLSEEDSFYSCGSLVLHVRKHMSISVQREGRASVS
jgi:hypothetical protein